jgi:hypothetical protein
MARGYSTTNGHVGIYLLMGMCSYSISETINTANMGLQTSRNHLESTVCFYFVYTWSLHMCKLPKERVVDTCKTPYSTQCYLFISVESVAINCVVFNEHG